MMMGIVFFYDGCSICDDVYSFYDEVVVFVMMFVVYVMTAI